MKKIICILTVGVLLSCKDRAEKNDVAIENNSVEQTNTNTVIDFNLINFKEIDDYKKIDFNSSFYNYDRYLVASDSITFNGCLNGKAKPADLQQAPMEFTLSYKYADVKFISNEGDETFLKYQYLLDLQKAPYDVITAWSIDTPLTIFLSKKKFEGFVTSGVVTFSADKQYFISTSSEPDYNILEIYKVQNGTITNIANLYSIDKSVNSVCWGGQLMFESAKGYGTSYFVFDLKKVLLDFENKTR